MAEVAQLNSDLMASTGFQARFDEGRSFISLQNRKFRESNFPTGSDDLNSSSSSVAKIILNLNRHPSGVSADNRAVTLIDIRPDFLQLVRARFVFS